MPSGSERPPAWATSPPSWSPPPAGAPAPNAAAFGAPSAASTGTPGQVRTGLVVLVAVLAELVIIGASANQWVATKIADDAVGSPSFWHLFEQSWLSFRWRASPHSGQTATWGSELALIGVTVVLSALVIWLVVRGAVTFWRAFLVTWLAVLGAALVGAFVRGLIDDSAFRAIGAEAEPARVTQALFGPLGPTQLVVVAGFVLGLLTGLIVALVAVQTRRGDGAASEGAPAAAPYAQPEQPPPYYGEHPSGAPAAPPWQDQHFEPRGRHTASPPPGATAPSGQASSDQPTTAYQPVSGEQPTTAYQPVSGEQPTTAFQRTPPPPAYQGGGYQAGSPPPGQPTFPRPPDDEDPHHA